MKKRFALSCLVALSSTMMAQEFNPSGAIPTTDVYRSGRSGFGMTTAPTTYKIEVESTTPDDGISITQRANTLHFRGSAGLFLNNVTGHNWGLLSTGIDNAIHEKHFAIYDLSLGLARFMIDGNNGNTGIATTTPNYKLEVYSDVANDGISIIQDNTNSAALHLYNASNLKHWAIFNTGTTSTQGSALFSIYDYNNNADRLVIDGTTGNVGINTNTPTDARLVVRQDLGGSPVINWAIYGNATSSAGTSSLNVGVEGRGSSMHASGENYGVRGRAFGVHNMYGGSFYAENLSSAANAGTYGVFADAVDPAGAAWAGYFNNRVGATAYYIISDQQFKDNIQLFHNAMDKIRLLKPSTYTFKTSEYKSMNLPEGQQIGLIAQELEKVFPELVTDVKEIELKGEKGEKATKIAAHKMVNYVNLIPVLISAIQEQDKTISEQTQAYAALQKQLDEQKELINQLSQRMGAINTVDNGITLAQNEPNPFSQETVIRYALPENAGNAVMNVYDLTGKQIASYALTQKGAGSITISAERLSPGIYIYSIVADGKVTDSKHMIVSGK